MKIETQIKAKKSCWKVKINIQLVTLLFEF